VKSLIPTNVLRNISRPSNAEREEADANDALNRIISRREKKTGIRAFMAMLPEKCVREMMNTCRIVNVLK
jgi:hypothetical protein